MRVTVNVNGLSLVHAGSGGVSTATVPDVCLTPDHASDRGVPVPYPNVALSADVTRGATSVRADGHAIAHAASVLAPTRGDEAGRGGGVVSGTTGAEASWLTWSRDVRVEGSPACRLTDKMLHNRGNAVDCGGILQEPVGRAAGAGARGTRRARAAKAKIGHLAVRVVQRSDDAAQNGKPVAGASVRIHGPETDKKATDAQGAHTFKRVMAGKYTIVATHACYPEARSAVTVAAGGTATRTLRLETASLKKVANRHGVDVTARWQLTAEMSNEFNGGILGTFFASIFTDKLFPAPPKTIADMKVALDPAFPKSFQDAGLSVMGTPLAWPTPGNTPEWTKTVKLSATAVVKRLIDVIAGGFGKLVDAWVVVNESLNLKYQDTTKQHGFWKRFGVWHDKPCRLWRNIRKCFVWAHRAAPHALLILNDYDVEGWDGKARTRAWRYHLLVDWLLETLPPKVKKRFAVGFQMHVATTPGRGDFVPQHIGDNVARYRAKGVPVVVTEIDCTTPALQAQRERLAKRYEAQDPAFAAAFTAKLAETETEAKKKAKKRHRPYKPLTKSKQRTLRANTMTHYLEDVGRAGNGAAIAAYDALERSFYLDPKIRPAHEAALREQATRYRDLFRELVRGGCKWIATWGIVDGEPEFRHFGYLFHPYLGCKPPYGPADDASYAEHGPAYRAPAYYGAVAGVLEAKKRHAKHKKKKKKGP